jgi:RimJ/RimL family protein N-acetyltransferase
MIHELSTGDFRRVEGLFQGRPQYLPVLSVIHGHYPGRVFVDDQARPRTALVWTLGRWAYIEGEALNDSFTKSLGYFMRKVIIPDSRQLKMNWFELYVPNSADWMQTIEEHLCGLDISKHFESLFLWNELLYRRFRSDYVFPREVSTGKAEIPILPEHARTAPWVAHDHKMKTAIGFQASVDGSPVAQCRSNGFAAGPEFMIDVVTFDANQRGKGYATAATVALLDYCWDNRMTPMWETTEDNLVSRWLAEKLGFSEHESYPVYATEF